MVATRGRTFKRPWRRSCHSSKLKSSSAPIGRKDSWYFHAVGSSNAPLLGSTAAEGLPRIGRTSIATRWRSCGLPQSASCSENFVIPPDVFGQTLRAQCRANAANVLTPRRPPKIRLGIGDVVSITIFEAAAGGLFIPSEAGARPGNFVTLPNQIVDSKGNITVPYAGTIRAAGRTPSEIQQAIIDALRDSPR